MKKLRIVQKFGGTSVATIAHIEAVSLKVKKEVQAGHHVAVVVSAMAGVTNQLVGYAKAIAGDALSPEYDAIATTGEQITAGLLALALQQIGISARSFMGWQIPIYTDKNHGNASITSVNPKHLLSCWDQNIVPVISGFQGITKNRRLTTLGRGGSDTTAVAIAAALEADRCDIFTDVQGVFSADPRIVPQARPLKTLSYREMLDLSSHGAKVLHAPCVEMAQKKRVPLTVLSSFEDQGDFSCGTCISDDVHSEESRISGITHTNGWVFLKLHSHQPLAPQARRLRNFFTKNDISAEIVVCDYPPQSTYIGVLVPQSHMATTLQFIEKQPLTTARSPKPKASFDFFDITVESSLAKISIIGLNLIVKNGFSDHLFRFINRIDLPLTIVGLTSRLFCVCVPEAIAPEIIRDLHHEFEMDQTNDTKYPKSSTQ